MWVLHALGRAVTKLLEAAAAVAVVFAAVWLAVKGVWKTGRWLVRHWRTTGTTAAVRRAWWHWFGLTSLAVTARRARGRIAAVVVAGPACRSSAGPAGGVGRGGSAGSSTPPACRAGYAPAASPSPTPASP